MSQMFIQYGAYAHAPGEANLISFSIRPRRSARSFQLANTVTAQVTGELKLAAGETEYDTNTKIQALDNALSRDGFDFGLYHSDGTPTHHYMQTSDAFNLTGNQVVYRSFPQNHNGEFSTGRDFAYAIQAEYRATESVIMDYAETITHVGTTGPSIRWREHKYHDPTFTVQKFNTKQRIVQSGYAVTLLTWLLPPPPILDIPFYMPDLTVITRRTPKRYPQGFEGHRIEWRYIFDAPEVVPALPRSR